MKILLAALPQQGQGVVAAAVVAAVVGRLPGGTAGAVE